MSHVYTIGKIARTAGLHVQTLPYYERKRLLTPRTRKVSGYRLYDEEAIKRLRFIKNAQELGFSLKEISELLNLRVNSKARCGDIQHKASKKLDDVKLKIERLNAIEKVLKRLIKTCHREETTEHCPILNSLEEEKNEG